jgi:hypothetical protein
LPFFKTQPAALAYLQEIKDEKKHNEALFAIYYSHPCGNHSISSRQFRGQHHT